MDNESAVKPLTLTVGLVVLAGAVACAAVILSGRPYGEDRTVEPVTPIDVALIGFKQTMEIDLKARCEMDDVSALAVDGNKSIWVAGDGKVVVFNSEGVLRTPAWKLSQPASCLAVAGDEDGRPKRLYVGAGDHIEVFDIDHTLAPDAAWPKPAEKAVLTAIAILEDEVFVADSLNRVVWRFSADGKVLGKIGERNAAKGIPGFMITDLKHFDAAAGVDGMLYVTNPRLLRIEAFTRDGDLRSHWGESSTELAGFCGCCNPTSLAVMRNGDFVTAEKGIVRVKLYSAGGQLKTVVAGPQDFRDTPRGLAVDGNGRVLVLDAARRSVRIFEPR